MPEIRLASEELAALEIVHELFAARFPNVPVAHFEDAYSVLKPILERRIQEDTALGHHAAGLGLRLPEFRQELLGALIRAAADSAGMDLIVRPEVIP